MISFISSCSRKYCDGTQALRYMVFRTPDVFFTLNTCRKFAYIQVLFLKLQVQNLQYELKINWFSLLVNVFQMIPWTIKRTKHYAVPVQVVTRCKNLTLIFSTNYFLHRSISNFTLLQTRGVRANPPQMFKITFLTTYLAS